MAVVDDDFGVAVVVVVVVDVDVAADDDAADVDVDADVDVGADGTAHQSHVLQRPLHLLLLLLLVDGGCSCWDLTRRVRCVRAQFVCASACCP